jgi:hypothetical protein
MTEVLRVVARVMLGWFGISFVVVGVWVMLSACVQRRDAAAALVGLGVMLVGSALLWGAFSSA